MPIYGIFLVILVINWTVYVILIKYRTSKAVIPDEQKQKAI